MLVLASAGFVFSAGGDGERGPPELPTTTHRSFATASHRRQSILGLPEKCEVAQPVSPVLVAFSAILLTPHSPDNALSFGAACAIQI
jgi:hypothetical protein